MREVRNINSSWQFSKDNREWTTVDLPHTWNGVDGQDGGNDYYRGKCYYKKQIDASDMQGDVLYAKFYAVNSSAEVFFDGEKVGAHDGGYSAFTVELPNKCGELVVTADNSPNDSVYPQQADFTFYGGIYRDVELISVPKNHFDGYFHITPVVIDDRAEITFDVKITDSAVIEYEIIDDDEPIYRGMKNKTTIYNPHLWDGVKDPHLYTARAYLIVDEQVVDMVESKFGVRSYEITADRGFILNGKEYPLRGVSRHQDRPVIGNALKYEHHKEDIDLICEMGANTVRLAHYQHSQDFYDLCDERGLVVWAEIPYISRHMNNGVANTFSQMYDLIGQCYNHPSIVVWGLSNEITMGGASDSYMIDNHKKLNDLCHECDKTRPTTIAALSMCGIDEKYIHISDVLSYNHYFGWYGGSTDMNGPWFDKFHAKYPNKPIGLSEYGCEALNWHTSTPTQGDYTEEYQAYYHEELIKQIMARPYLWATHVWNMFDFAADARSEGGENGMNHKGLVTFDRKYKKDSFYAYKAWLSDEPFVHICGKRYIDRAEDRTKITVYTNQNSVELFANGVSVGKQSRGEYPFFYFDIALDGEMELVAIAGECKDNSFVRKVDEMNMDYVMQDANDVINWFEIDTPTGYLSVNDTFGDILATFRGKLVLLAMAKMFLDSGKKQDGKKDNELIGFSIKGISKDMIEMFKGFTVRRGISMLGGRFSKEQILEINHKLNRIKKRNK